MMNPCNLLPGLGVSCYGRLGGLRGSVGTMGSHMEVAWGLGLLRLWLGLLTELRVPLLVLMLVGTGVQVLNPCPMWVQALNPFLTPAHLLVGMRVQALNPCPTPAHLLFPKLWWLHLWSGVGGS